RMPEDRVKLLVPHFGTAEGVFVVAPPRIRLGEVGEAQVVLSILERHLKDSRLLRGTQVAHAPIGVANLDGYRAARAPPAARTGYGKCECCCVGDIRGNRRAVEQYRRARQEGATFQSLRTALRQRAGEHVQLRLDPNVDAVALRAVSASHEHLLRVTADC